MIFERLEFQGKLWEIKAKVEGYKLDDPKSLKDNYGCDLVIKNSQNIYFILNEIIDVEFEEVE